MIFKFIRRHSTGTTKWIGGDGGGGEWGWGERGQFSSVQNSGRTITLIEFSNITFLMRRFKDKII